MGGCATPRSLFSRGLLPLFEAVINSIHGLEEANIPTESGRIRVVIERDMVHSLLDTLEGKKSGRQPLNETSPASLSPITALGSMTRILMPSSPSIPIIRLTKVDAESAGYCG